MTDEIVYDEGDLDTTPSDDADTGVDSDTTTDSFGKNPTDKIEKLKKDLAEALAQKQEYLDGWQRSKADYINLKKRSEEERAGIRDYATEDFALAVIPVIDSFEMAFKNEKALEAVPKVWTEGVKFIYNQLVTTLSDYGVKAINPLGEMFDVNKHTAQEMTKVDSEADNGKIVEVIQKGYEFKTKIIRHAVVKVGEFTK